MEAMQWIIQAVFYTNARFLTENPRRNIFCLQVGSVQKYFNFKNRAKWKCLCARYRWLSAWNLNFYFYVQENFKVNHWIFQTIACFHSFHIFNDRTNWFFVYLADVLNSNRWIIFAFVPSICQQTSYLNWSFFSHNIACTVNVELYPMK